MHGIALRSWSMSASDDESGDSSQATACRAPARCFSRRAGPFRPEARVRLMVKRSTGWFCASIHPMGGWTVGAGAGLQEEDSEGEVTASETGGSTAQPGEAEVRDRCSTAQHRTARCNAL